MRRNRIEIEIASHSVFKYLKILMAAKRIRFYYKIIWTECTEGKKEREFAMEKEKVTRKMTKSHRTPFQSVIWKSYALHMLNLFFNCLALHLSRMIVQRASGRKSERQRNAFEWRECILYIFLNLPGVFGTLTEAKWERQRYKTHIHTRTHETMRRKKEPGVVNHLKEIHFLFNFISVVFPHSFGSLVLLNRLRVYVRDLNFFIQLHADYYLVEVNVHCVIAVYAFAHLNERMQCACILNTKRKQFEGCA